MTIPQQEDQSCWQETWLHGGLIGWIFLIRLCVEKMPWIPSMALVKVRVKYHILSFFGNSRLSLYLKENISTKRNVWPCCVIYCHIKICFLDKKVHTVDKHTPNMPMLCTLIMHLLSILDLIVIVVQCHVAMQVNSQWIDYEASCQQWPCCNNQHFHKHQLSWMLLFAF